MRMPNNTAKGFTLVELLVVIAIISVLLTILVPSLQYAKGQARHVVCLTNLRSLALGFSMYVTENDDKLFSASWTRWTPDLVPYIDGDIPAPTGPEPMKEYIKAGALYPYVESVDVYCCPADDRSFNFTLTYTVAGGINSPQSWAPHCKKFTNIKNPEEKYVFVEEGKSTGDAWVLQIPLALGGYTDHEKDCWGDPLSIWHNKHNTNFGFADGRADMRQWVDRRTLEMAEWNIWNGWPSPGNPDLLWIKRHYPVADR